MADYFDSVMVLTLTVLYLVVGVMIGRYSWKAWHERKARPRAAFLAFPVSTAMEIAGKRPFNFVIHELRRHQGAIFLNAVQEEERLARNEYLIMTAIFWPAKIAWNVPAIGVLSAARLIAR